MQVVTSLLNSCEEMTASRHGAYWLTLPSYIILILQSYDGTQCFTLSPDNGPESQCARKWSQKCRVVVQWTMGYNGASGEREQQSTCQWWQLRRISAPSSRLRARATCASSLQWSEPELQRRTRALLRGSWGAGVSGRGFLSFRAKSFSKYLDWMTPAFEVEACLSP